MDFLQNLKGEYLRMLKTGKEVMSWYSVSSIGGGVFAMLQGFLNRERLSYDFLFKEGSR